MDEDEIKKLAYKMYSEMYDAVSDIRDKILEENSEISHADMCSVISNAHSMFHAAIIGSIRQTVKSERRDEFTEAQIEYLKSLLEELKEDKYYSNMEDQV